MRRGKRQGAGLDGDPSTHSRVYYFLRPQVGGLHSRVKSAPCANRGASEGTG